MTNSSSSRLKNICDAIFKVQRDTFQEICETGNETIRLFGVFRIDDVLDEIGETQDEKIISNLMKHLRLDDNDQKPGLLATKDVLEDVFNLQAGYCSSRKKLGKANQGQTAKKEAEET